MFGTIIGTGDIAVTIKSPTLGGKDRCGSKN